MLALRLSWRRKNNSFVPLFSTFNALVIAANNPKCSQLTEPYPPTCPQVMSKKMRPAHYLTETHQHTQSNTGEPTQHRQPWAFGVKQEKQCHDRKTAGSMTTRKTVTRASTRWGGIHQDIIERFTAILHQIPRAGVCTGGFQNTDHQWTEAK